MSDNNYLSINKVALMLDISVITIKRWYIWYESERYEVPKGLSLPPYYHMDKRMTKFFKVSDVPKLEEFQRKINGEYKGAMAQYHADKSWGHRGKVFQRSNLRKAREKGEYAPRTKEDPTDISKELDKKEEQKWQAEQRKKKS